MTTESSINTCAQPLTNQDTKSNPNPNPNLTTKQHAITADWARLAAWHLPGGPVGPPARWAATSNFEREVERRRGPIAREGGLYVDNLFTGTPSS